MKARKALMDKARLIGVEVEENADMVVELLAPVGQVFVANDCHCYCSANFIGQTRHAKAQYEDCLSALDMGLVKCDEEDCDTCQGL